ncbi:MAG: hypothetical protein JXX14_19490, partial [Deltaproteobacteria bacterium]|nr:hypothetical protein [Deltaproteobacteria bacterium]
SIIDADTTLIWNMNLSGIPSSVANVLQLAHNDSDELENQIITAFNAGAGTTSYLPDAPGPHTIPVYVERQVLGVTVAQSETIDFSLSILPTNDNVNVTILLDRSGSMASQSRWIAACSGAGIFAHLMATDASGGTNKLGVYWFNSGGAPTGTFTASAATGGDYALIGAAAGALADGAIPGPSVVEDQCNNLSPSMATSIGAGMNECKTALLAADPVANAERIILVLSDGMENQSPMLSSLFGTGGSWGDPHIRVYPMALCTSSSWVDRLKTIVTATGGYPDLDVFHIPAWDNTTTPGKISDWFTSMFKSLFGLSSSAAPPDPLVASGATATDKVQVHSGQSKIIFQFNHNDPAPSQWEFTVEPPFTGKKITRDIALNTVGMTVCETAFTTLISVTWPLQLEGCEHAWTGEWTMRAKRTGRSSASCAMGAMVKENMRYRVELLANAKTLPDDKIIISAKVADQKGRAITNASVVAEITSPVEWQGIALTKTARKAPEKLYALSKSTSKANRDIIQPADLLFSELMENRKTKPAATQKISLTHQKNGIYTATFYPSLSGQYNIDVICTGTRVAPNAEVSSLKKQMLQAVSKNTNQVAATVGRREFKSYKTAALHKLNLALAGSQDYRLIARQTLKVAFLPSIKTSTFFGYMENKSTICLHVEPLDKRLIPLGPGFADHIYFTTPAGQTTKWAATDMLDGTYEVLIPLKGKSLALRAEDTSLLSSGLTLGHQEVTGGVKIRNDSLRLSGFAANVCGVSMPITVFALAGNTKTKEVHLLSCRYASQLSDDHLIWFEDIQDIKKHGYDTCEHCLPLICNMNTMEAHKPICTFAGRIKKAHRKECPSWSIAKREGYDGCKYCMPHCHSR